MAGRRTYVPGLKYFSNLLCRYIQKWQPKLNETLSPTAQTLLEALLEACLALSDALPVEEIGD